MTPRTITAALWFGLALVWVAIAAHHASAQATSAQTVIAQAAVAECGWRLGDCHAATWHTLERRRGARTLARMARAYCSIFKGPAVGRRQWVRSLPSAGVTLPQGWPQAASWPRHSEWWQRVHSRAGAYLRGEVADPCKGQPRHFGAGADLARFPPAKWTRVDCGNTGRQRFLEAR